MRRMGWIIAATIITLLNPLMMLSGAAAAVEPTYIVALGDSITHGEGGFPRRSVPRPTGEDAESRRI
jgi:hypothetical protein